MMESQRETLTLHSHQTQSFSANQESKHKKKHIKKQKDSGKNYQLKLSKQERMKLQKEKNRQAAQRSRDLHREYVNNLQKQITELKDQLETNRRICMRCKSQLSDTDMLNDHPVGNSINFQHNLFSDTQSEFKEETEEKVEERQYYLRVRNQEDEFSYLKTILFIAAIVVAVLLVQTSGGETVDHNRHLLELYKPPTSKPIISDDFTILADDRPLQPIQTQMPEVYSNVKNGLVVRNSIINDQCINSLFEEKKFSLTNLRTTHPPIGNTQLNEGILLCSYQQQKQGPQTPYEQQQQSALRLFLLGSQVKEMITTNSSIKKFIENNVQLNGIYRIAAEIKKVELISHHNCLL